MKNILLLVHDDAGQEARFQAALDLARALDGHLTCLDVAIMPIVAPDIYAVSAEAAFLEGEKEREAENRRRLEARLAREDVPWNWIDEYGEPASVLKEHAGLADVIVVSRQLDSDQLPDMRRIASEVVIGTDKAVVAVPADSAGFDVAGHAMVAWDGSEEAAKALQAAVPLLRLARSVTVVEVENGGVGTPAQEAAVYLSRHDISVAMLTRSAKSRPTAEALLAEAGAEGAAYMVMGAFGRSRLAEAIFGGVSREMLTTSPIPVVMAH